MRCNEEREIIFNFGLILIDYLRDKFITVHNQMSENPTVNCSAVVSRVRKDRVLFGRFGLHVSECRQQHPAVRLVCPTVFAVNPTAQTRISVRFSFVLLD